MYIQLNAGRNVGSTPLSLASWIRFQAELISTLEALDLYESMVRSQDIEIHYGQGSWQGVAEDSVHVSIFIEGDFEELISPAAWQAFDESIGYLKQVWSQDEIVVIVK